MEVLLNKDMFFFKQNALKTKVNVRNELTAQLFPESILAMYILSYREHSVTF